jgi:hypothetical protein
MESAVQERIPRQKNSYGEEHLKATEKTTIRKLLLDACILL